jgi:trk system potassium uptake protein
MKVVVANLGFILQTTGVITLLAVIPAFIYHEQTSLISFFITSAIFLVSGFVMNSQSERKELDFKASCILFSIVFLLLGIVGAIPYIYTNIFASSDVISKIINSLFESVSGYTTTGLTMVTNIDSLPRSIIFYRSLTQWIGGIGVVFVVLVFFNSTKGLDKLGDAIGIKKLTSTMTNSYIRILGIYAAYTLIFFCLLYATGLRDWINNISVVFSAISTGGFSPVDNLSTLIGFPNNLIIGLLMIIGGTSFTVHYRIFSGRLKSIVNLEFIVFISIIILFSVIFAFLTRVDIATSFFHIASASSTTGFSFIDLSTLAINAKMLLFVLMFIGGTTSSTAGGVKIISVLVFFKSIPWLMRGVITGNLGRFNFRGTELKFLNIYTYLLVITMAIAIIVIFAFAFTSYGYSLIDSVFALTSALSNTGLYVGITNLTLPIVLKLILILVMIVGRIGIVALFVALMPKIAEKTNLEPVSAVTDIES